MYVPPSHPPELSALAELKIHERERQRDLDLSRGDTSPRKHLSRRAYVLMQLAVIVLLIVGVVVLYHFFYNLY
jgi:hypothetical protein